MYALIECCCNGCSSNNPMKVLALMLLMQLTMALVVAVAVMIKETDK